MPLIIISVYLPARANAESEVEFCEVVAQLEEIITKYSMTHQIVLAGDWNASLSRAKPTVRDGRFSNFIRDNLLKLPTQQTEEPTFYGNNCHSCIDYFLFRVNSGDDNADDYKLPSLLNLGLQASNVSDHVAISTTIELDKPTDESRRSRVHQYKEYPTADPIGRTVISSLIGKHFNP